jgi:hypothetical protein
VPQRRTRTVALTYLRRLFAKTFSLVLIFLFNLTKALNFDIGVMYVFWKRTFRASLV